MRGFPYSRCPPHHLSVSNSSAYTCFSSPTVCTAPLCCSCTKFVLRLYYIHCTIFVLYLYCILYTICICTGFTTLYLYWIHYTIFVLYFYYIRSQESTLPFTAGYCGSQYTQTIYQSLLGILAPNRSPALARFTSGRLHRSSQCFRCPFYCKLWFSGIIEVAQVDHLL